MARKPTPELQKREDGTYLVFLGREYGPYIDVLDFDDYGGDVFYSISLKGETGDFCAVYKNGELLYGAFPAEITLVLVRECHVGVFDYDYSDESDRTDHVVLFNGEVVGASEEPGEGVNFYKGQALFTECRTVDGNRGWWIKFGTTYVNGPFEREPELRLKPDTSPKVFQYQRKLDGLWHDI